MTVFNKKASNNKASNNKASNNKASNNKVPNKKVAKFLRSTPLQLFAIAGLTAGAFMLMSPSPIIAAANANANDTALSVEQQQQVKAIIKDALTNDPELLKEAIIALQIREQQGAESAAQSVLQEHHQQLYNTASDPFKGAENPEITMIYFTDFNCPYCKKIEPAINKLVEQYPQLKVVIKMVPLQGEGSRVATELAQTVWLNEPEKYLTLKNKLMESPRGLNGNTIAKVAKMTNTEHWLTNTDPAVAKQVHDNLTLMRNIGLGGTPSMIIGDTVIPGLVSYEVLESTLQQAISSQENKKQAVNDE
ncbi:DsbA family protein [Shewanella sp. 1_MG-2023]|uniref:DsbA family protein n=1 Tax=unclassified Shewanella TaxID=196818 RepID=UPI0026E2D548|nr:MULTISPECIES: DsbA family protein [unclassified Shewanella]MDO6612436.1 DsbA family protein [Shewanella sp. 7_MG-2023]MDO6772523.1 DsbA family protein [Shewanella sp. 2_MG-2023]MDO6794479.1 DsbA family protein [Shewanella sp. 1_MG-2023]